MRMLTEFYIKNFVNTLEELAVFAKKFQTCKRKACGSVIIRSTVIGLLDKDPSYHNGPVGDHECTNEKGNCGCMHAEPKSILTATRRWGGNGNSVNFLLTSFSSCQQCSNIIQYCEFIDCVIYETFAPHWKDADSRLRKNIAVFAKEFLVTKGGHAAFEEWHLRCRNDKRST